MQIYASQRHDPALGEILLPTISMTIDYIAPAVLGDWLEGETTLLRVTKSMLSRQTVASVGESVVLRASCIYRNTGRKTPRGSALVGLFPD